MVQNALDIISRMVGAQGHFSPEVAKTLLSWQFTQDERHHVTDLLDRSHLNVLSSEEQRELDRYLALGDLLDALHAKARKVLQTK